MSTRNRIAHLIVRLDTGGAEKSLYRLVKATRAELSHHIICFGAPTPIGADIEALGVKVSWLDYSKVGPLVVWQAWRLLRKERPQVVQGWMYFGNVIASVLALGLSRSVKVAWNIRQAPGNFALEKRRTRWAIALARLSWRGPDLVIYNSFAGEQAHEQFGFNRGPHRVIPNGLDLQEFKPSKVARARWRDKFDVGEQPWVGLVCRYHPLKGVGEFLQAVKMLRGAGLDARFALAGPGMQIDNPDLMMLLRRYAITENDIDLMGVIDDPAGFLPALDLVVIASVREGTPNILLEAMACGVNTVATMVGDVSLILQDSKRRVAPADVEALAEAITLACADVDRDTRISREQKYLAEHYALEQCMTAYLETYQALVH